MPERKTCLKANQIPEFLWKRYEVLGFRFVGRKIYLLRNLRYVPYAAVAEHYPDIVFPRAVNVVFYLAVCQKVFHLIAVQTVLRRYGFAYPAYHSRVKRPGKQFGKEKPSLANAAREIREYEIILVLPLFEHGPHV